MPTADIPMTLLMDIARDAGLQPEREPLSNEQIAELQNLARLREPKALIVEVLKARQLARRHARNCSQAAEAAAKLEEMLRELMSGPALHYRLVSIYDDGQHPKAVCSANGQLREFSIHTEVNLQDLETLQPWEYVRVKEQVVIGVWRDDPCLYPNAHGNIVTFKDFADESQGLARVARQGQDEEIVKIVGPLREESLAPNSRLVLHRDDPRCAIAQLPAQTSRSRFEVPLDSINQRLEDLAGMENVAERLMIDVLKRVVYPSIQAQFGLDPLRGVLLTSSKPGMGKTSFVGGFAHWLQELGQQIGFETVLYMVKPNEFKSMWHGEDARIIRDDLFGCLQARRRAPRERGLFQLLVLDEIDCFGRRPGGNDAVVSAAQSDALEALLVEVDGMVRTASDEEHPAHLLVIGMSNRPDRIDDAVKRPGRLGDLVLDLNDIDRRGAESICAIYARGANIPWQLDGTILQGLDEQDLRLRILRPALAQVFPAPVLRYYTDSQRRIDVTAGEIMAGTHYRKAMTLAKDRAAERMLRGIGLPAVTYDDIVAGLFDAAQALAAQMEADPQMLVRHLHVKTLVARVEIVPREELETHRFIRVVA